MQLSWGLIRGKMAVVLCVAQAAENHECWHCHRLAHSGEEWGQHAAEVKEIILSPHPSRYSFLERSCKSAPRKGKVFMQKIFLHTQLTLGSVYLLFHCCEDLSSDKKDVVHIHAHACAWISTSLIHTHAHTPQELRLLPILIAKLHLLTFIDP